MNKLTRILDPFDLQEEEAVYLPVLWASFHQVLQLIDS